MQQTGNHYNVRIYTHSSTLPEQLTSTTDKQNSTGQLTNTTLQHNAPAQLTSTTHQHNSPAQLTNTTHQHNAPGQLTSIALPSVYSDQCKFVGQRLKLQVTSAPVDKRVIITIMIICMKKKKNITILRIKYVKSHNLRIPDESAVNWC